MRWQRSSTWDGLGIGKELKSGICSSLYLPVVSVVCCWFDVCISLNRRRCTDPTWILQEERTYLYTPACYTLYRSYNSRRDFRPLWRELRAVSYTWLHRSSCRAASWTFACLGVDSADGGALINSSWRAKKSQVTGSSAWSVCRLKNKNFIHYHYTDLTNCCRCDQCCRLQSDPNGSYTPQQHLQLDQLEHTLPITTTKTCPYIHHHQFRTT